ncbi:MAG: CehA/McbA family metallohydrolase [Solirubrobacterales bacterium]
MPKLKLSLLATVIAAFFFLPSLAAACTLPTTPVGGSQDISQYVNEANPDKTVKSGNFGPELNGKFIQVPFVVPAGTTGLRIRYCYEEVNLAAENSTLDLGVYEPNAADPGNFTVAQSRGWTGSAVKMIGIAENGFTDAVTYKSGDTNGASGQSRKAYVPGKTNRGYAPGPIPEGEWAIELGAGFIDPNDSGGVDWEIEVIPSSDPGWSNTPFTPDPYVPNVDVFNPGWYQGDLHVHGESEPGNALMSDTLDLAFDTPPGGTGLDFVTLVDHNNNISRSYLGGLQAAHPGKVVIPGTEMTTYDGHFNAQGNSPLVDFRLGEIKKLVGGVLQNVRGAEDPSSRFASIQAGGGWAQINHPKIFETAPSVCRGCFWNYDDARTDFSKVNAIEIQTGPAGIPAGAPTGMNPFTQPAIDYYEHALSTGAHIAAVGSSDDHKAGGATGPFDSSVGHGATVVHADSLTQTAIIDAVKAGHTYVKPFGPDAPDVEMTANTPDGTSVIPGDSVTGSSLAIAVRVTGADSGVRPGSYTLAILRDGVQVDSTPVSGADFTYAFNTTETGRYSFELTRAQDNGGAGIVKMIEGYSTPVWFTFEPEAVVAPSNKFSFKGVKLNKKKGTAKLKVKVAGPGRIKLSGKNLVKKSTKAKKANQVVSLTVKAKGKLKKKLNKKGKTKVKAIVKFTPTGGKTATKSKSFKLIKKKAKKNKKRR